MIKTIDRKIRTTDSIGIFHDSRSDIRLVSKQVNLLTDKINEIITALNNIQEQELNK